MEQSRKIIYKVKKNFWYGVVIVPSVIYIMVREGQRHGRQCLWSFVDVRKSEIQ